MIHVTDLAMHSTVTKIIHIYPLLSQCNTILCIVVFSDITRILKTLTSLIFHSVYPDYQLCKAYCSCHLQIISLKLMASSVDFMTLHCSLIVLFDYIKPWLKLTDSRVLHFSKDVCFQGINQDTL